MPSPSFLGGKLQTKKGSANSEVISAEDVDKYYVSKASPKVVEGSNAAMGVVTLVAGSKVVTNTRVTANSRIFLTSQADGGTPGSLRVSARTAGTSFTITSSSGSDTSVVAYMIVEPDA
ncbi:hypothetical protein Nit79A3_1457 [Nitrosomonas sp. Is79A3]|uniref:hypothetical protein n=1 Tax=Nitrosomonas sp. (strain Is79A3) TaxID=261292 RepID=UPI000215D0CF